MLSYRHSFHAGNHADVFKHFVLFCVLSYFNRKDKPYWYIDTHAGTGLYDLTTGEAQKVGEYRQGIERLRGAERLSETLQQFRLAVEHSLVGTAQAATHYCGSPWLAQSLLRPQDRLRLFELHPADSGYLRQNMQHTATQRAQVFCDDGFKGLLAMLPPPCRRAVILLDPPYEQKSDYRQIVQTLKAAQKKFATGCYLVWYPCLSREESRQLPEHLKTLSPDNYLHAEVHVCQPRSDGFGMHGSGMFVVNPPYVLPEILGGVLPELTGLLAQDDGAHFVLDAQCA